MALAPLPLRQLITIVTLTGSGYISGTVHAFLSLRKESALLVLPRVEPELFQLEPSAWQPASCTAAASGVSSSSENAIWGPITSCLPRRRPGSRCQWSMSTPETR